MMDHSVLVQLGRAMAVSHNVAVLADVGLSDVSRLVAVQRLDRGDRLAS